MTRTTTIKMAMLFLSTAESNTPVLIDTAGELSTNFDYNGQEVYHSCGVTFRNKQLIFGGQTNRRQILEINDCGLKTIGSIPFDHDRGACSSTDDAIVLCFNSNDSNDYNRCRMASSPNGRWSQMLLSNYAHRYTSIASSSDGFLAV